MGVNDKRDRQFTVDHPSRRLRADGEVAPLQNEAATTPSALLWIAVGIFVILTVGVLYLGGALFIPITISALAYLSLRPIVAKLCARGLPHALAAGIVIVTLFATLGLVVGLLYSPAQKWIKTAPDSLVQVRANFRAIAEPLSALDRADEVIDKATPGKTEPEQRVTVSVERPSMVDQSVLINKTVRAITFVAAIAVLTFFMLSHGDDLLNRMLGVLPNSRCRDEVLEKIGDIQTSVGRYLAQISCINIGLGFAVTAVMWLCGMPTPVLWGVMATLFNFIPYVGPIAATALVFLAAASSFDTIGKATATAFAFWLTTAVEGQFVTPSILGKTLRVGPVVVLIAVAFWGFLWGLPGVFLAVPLLIVQRKVFASFEATYPFAVILGENPCRSGNETVGTEPADCEVIKEDQPIAETA